MLHLVPIHRTAFARLTVIRRQPPVPRPGNHPCGTIPLLAAFRSAVKRSFHCGRQPQIRPTDSRPDLTLPPPGPTHPVACPAAKPAGKSTPQQKQSPPPAGHRPCRKRALLPAGASETRRRAPANGRRGAGGRRGESGSTAAPGNRCCPAIPAEAGIRSLLRNTTFAGHTDLRTNYRPGNAAAEWRPPIAARRSATLQCGALVRSFRRPYPRSGNLHATTARAGILARLWNTTTRGAGYAGRREILR